MTRSRRSGYICLLLCLLSAPWAAAEDSKSEGAVIPAREADSSWVLGVCEPSLPPDLDASQRLLAAGFNERLLSLLVTRAALIIRPPEEQEAIQTDRSREALDKIGKEIQDKLKNRDLLLYKGFETWKYRSEYAKASSGIREARERLSLEETKRYAIAQEALLAFPNTNLEGSFLSAPEDLGFDEYSRKNALDAIMVSGFKNQYGYLCFHWAIHSRWTKEVLSGDEIIFSRSSRDEASIETVRLIVSRISGLRLSTLSVLAESEDTLFFIDGQPVPSDGSIIYLEAGQHLIQADRVGYLSLSKRLTLRGGESLRLRPQLEAIGRLEVEVSASDEQGNSLFGVPIKMDSLFVGETPLVLSLARDRTAILEAKLPGFQSRSLLVKPEEGRAIEFTLPSIVAGAKTVKDTRKRFYTAFGWFFVSIPVSIMLTGIHNSYGEALERTGDTTYGVGYNASLVTMGLSWGASAILFGNTAWRLIQYVGTSDTTGIVYPEISGE